MLLLHRANAARAALLLSAGLSFATPIWAQNAALNAAADNAATAPLQAALSDEKTPLSLATSALDASWRRFKIGKSLDSNFKAMDKDHEETDDYSYFTRGETLKVGDETFLMAYRTHYDPDSDADTEATKSLYSEYSDYADLMNAEAYTLPSIAGNPATTDGYLRIFSTQTLNLCLLNARNLEGLGDIRAFEVKTDLIQVVTAADRERAQQQALAERASLTGEAVNSRVVSDLQQVGLAMSMYIQDYDEKAPPMRSSQSMADIRKYAKRGWDSPKLATAQQVLGPYVKSYEIFAHPTTREIYRPNLNVSGRSLAGLYESSPRVVTFYEATPAPDGTRAVLYLDGHVRRERETDWPAIRAASDKIAPPLQFGKRASSAKPASGTVTLSGAAAMAYTIAQWKKNPQHTQALYLSKSVNRVYYRDDKTHQAIWVDPPAKGIVLPTIQAAPFRHYKGYNGQTRGRVLSDDFEAV